MGTAKRNSPVTMNKDPAAGKSILNGSNSGKVFHRIPQAFHGMEIFKT